MTSTTLSGPAASASQARSRLIDAGYVVLDAPTMDWLELAPGETLLSVTGGHSDVASVVTEIGWRHRGTANALAPAVAYKSMFPSYGAQG